MKKVFSLMAAFALMVTLSACGEEAAPCEPEVIEKEVIKEVEKEVIKEVKVPVEVKVEIPAEVEMVRQYQPGTYFKATEADEKGVVTFAVVVVDKYGQIVGVHVDNTSTQNEYKYDEEAKKLYVRVEGVEDVIPHSYRLVDLKNLDKLPTVEDAITTDDLVVGFPWHDAKIAKLTDVKANETQQIVDYFSDKDNTWSDQMNKVAAEIVKEQTTYGINLYVAGDQKLTNTVSGVKVSVEKELELVQSILDNEAKLGADTVLATKENAPEGYFKASEFEFKVSNPVIAENGSGVVYNTAYVVTDAQGEIAGVVVDETYANAGKSTTKMVLGEGYNMRTASPIKAEWFEQAQALGAKVVANQGVDGLKVEEKKLTNVAGVTIKVDGILSPLKDAIKELKDLKLVDGVYQGELNGDLLTLVIKGGDIVAANLDTLYPQDQAYITVDGEDFELYTYEKGSVDLSLEEVKTTTLIYKDGESYRYAENENVDKGYEIGDTVKFDYDGYAEEETIKAVKANSTKKALGDRYGMATEEGKLEWYEQAAAWEKQVVEKGQGSFNMIDASHTDSVAGLTIAIDGYNQLLAKVLLLATNGDNVAKNVVPTTFAELGLNEAGADYRLAKGNYTYTSDVPTEEGGLYVFNMMVLDKDNVLLYVDETIENDGKLTTKTLLGEDYKVKVVDEELVKSVDKKDSTFSKFMTSKLSSQDVIDFSNALRGYDYELDTELEYDRTPVAITNDEFLAPYINGMEKALLAGLRARVAETMDELVENLTNTTNGQLKDKFMVAAEGNDSKPVQLNVASLLTIGTDDRGQDINIEFDMEALSDFVDVDDNRSGLWTLSADADEVAKTAPAKYAYSIEFDDYEAVNKEFTINVMSNYDYKLRMLNTQYAKDADAKKDDDANITLNKEYSKLLSGQKVVLDLTANSYAENPVNRLGNDDANKDLFFRVAGIGDDVKVELVSMPVIAKIANATYEATLTFTSGTTYSLDLNNDSIDSTNATTVELPTLGFKFDLEAAKANYTKGIATIDLNNATFTLANKTTALDSSNEADTKVIEKLVNGLSEVVNNETYPATTEVKLTADFDADVNKKGLVVSDVTFKGFYDNYDQDDEKLMSYQKGEASRDFTFTVYSVESALKAAKEATIAGKILDTVTANVPVELTNSKTIGIEGVAINWFEGEDGLTELVNDATAEQKAKGIIVKNIETTSTTQQVKLTAKYLFTDTTDDTDNAEKFSKVFEFSVKPTNAKELDKKVKAALSDTFFTKYVDIEDPTLLTKSFSAISVDEIDNHPIVATIVVKDNNGKEINKTTYLYDAIMAQISGIKAGEMKQAKFGVEVTYDYDGEERLVSNTYTMNVFANKAHTKKAAPTTIEFEENSSLAEKVTTITNAMKADKEGRFTVPEFKLAATEETEVNVDMTGLNFTGTLVFQGVSKEGQAEDAKLSNPVKIVVPEGSAAVYGDYDSLEVTTANSTFVLGEGAKVGKLTIKGGRAIIKGTVETLVSKEGTEKAHNEVVVEGTVNNFDIQKWVDLTVNGTVKNFNVGSTAPDKANDSVVTVMPNATFEFEMTAPAVVRDAAPTIACNKALGNIDITKHVADNTELNAWAIRQGIDEIKLEKDLTLGNGTDPILFGAPVIKTGDYRLTLAKNVNNNIATNVEGNVVLPKDFGTLTADAQIVVYVPADFAGTVSSASKVVTEVSTEAQIKAAVQNTAITEINMLNDIAVEVNKELSDNKHTAAGLYVLANTKINGNGYTLSASGLKAGENDKGSELIYVNTTRGGALVLNNVILSTEGVEGINYTIATKATDLSALFTNVTLKGDVVVAPICLRSTAVTKVASDELTILNAKEHKIGETTIKAYYVQKADGTESYSNLNQKYYAINYVKIADDFVTLSNLGNSYVKGTTNYAVVVDAPAV